MRLGGRLTVITALLVGALAGQVAHGDDDFAAPGIAHRAAEASLEAV